MSQWVKKKARIMKILENCGDEVALEARRLVAHKTGKLEDSIAAGAAVDHGNTISVEVGSKGVNYAKFVEHSKKKKKYHRFGSVVYTGKGQEFLTRALKNKENLVLEKLKNA